MKALSSLILFVARLFLASSFIFAGASKVIFFDQNVQYMASKGMGAIPIFLICAIIVELAGGLSLILGYKTRFGASILFLFLIPVTLIFHAFWSVTGAEQVVAQFMFFKNLDIAGGLLYVICFGAGGFSIDACCSCSSKKPEQEPEQK